jgi:hypothetical protein
LTHKTANIVFFMLMSLQQDQGIIQDFEFGGVLKYEWGSGSAEPGRRAPPRMAQPCWGWVREGVAPSRRGGPGV